MYVCVGKKERNIYGNSWRDAEEGTGCKNGKRELKRDQNCGIGKRGLYRLVELVK